MAFKKNTKPQNQEKVNQRKVLKNLYAHFEGRENVLNAFERKIFPIEP